MPDAPRSPEPFVVAPKADDLSSNLHRIVIGCLGAAMPFLVVVINHCWSTDGLEPKSLTSVSAYYYSSAVSVFAGVLAALAVYLLTYKGYCNPHRIYDLAAARVAGCAAIVVACFPTSPPVGTVARTRWSGWVGSVHLVAAAILFTSFACFSLFLFPKTSQSPRLSRDKWWRNLVYYFCGSGIVACMVWVAIATQFGKPIFLPETLALELFALSWLTKGKTDQTARRLVRRGIRRLGDSPTHPSAS